MKVTTLSGSVAAVVLIPCLCQPMAGTAMRGKNEQRNSPVYLLPVFKFTYGSSMRVSIAFNNCSTGSVKYLALGPSNDGDHRVYELYFYLKKENRTIHPPQYRYLARTKKDVRTLARDGSVVQTVNISGAFGKLKPGRYELRARYKMEAQHSTVRQFALTPFSLDRTVALIDIAEALPSRFSTRTSFRFKHRSEYEMLIGEKPRMVSVEIGIGPTRGKEATLFAVIRESKPGKTKIERQPVRVFRLGFFDPKSQIETLLYNPFPESTKPLMLLHALVTQPDKSQRYFVIDLSGRPVSRPVLTTSKILKPGTLYKLQRQKLGPVRLVPVKAGNGKSSK